MAFADALASADDAVLLHLRGAETVIYTSGYGVSATIDCVFDRAYELATSGDLGFSTTAPALFCRISDLTSDPRSDKAAELSVNGERFGIKETKPDGRGKAVLVLGRK